MKNKYCCIAIYLFWYKQRKPITPLGLEPVGQHGFFSADR